MPTKKFNVDLNPRVLHQYQKMFSVNGFSVLGLTYRNGDLYVDYEGAEPQRSEVENVIRSACDIVYDPAALIDWAIDNIPAMIGSVHESAFLKFVENPKGFKNLLMKRATMLDERNNTTLGVDTVNIIINKARELGADV